ncbi:MAG: type II restriction endonuclease [Candidatus Micrarchaeia archaeon]
MRHLEIYNKKDLNNEEKVFDFLINTLIPSVTSWDYFVNWDKVNKNLNGIKVELNLLNSLLDSQNLENDFISLVKKYPNIIKAIPVLLAVREKNLKILKDYQEKDLAYLSFDFNKTAVSDSEAKNYFIFLKETQLTELFKNKKIKNFVDYVFGVEVGLDSNGRKNRGGKLMEKITEVFVKDAISNNFEYLAQATPKKIKLKWGFEVKFEKSQRSFDFAIFNVENKKLYLIESNFYNGGGSKLKSVCGEFKTLFNELGKQGIELIWITDGKGWLTARNPLRETFDNNHFVFNLELLKLGALKEVITGV